MTTSEKFVKDIQNNDGELSDGRIIRFGVAVDPDYVPLDPDEPDPAYIHQQDRSYVDYIVLTHEQLNKAKHDMIHGDDSLIPSVREIHHLIRHWHLTNIIWMASNTLWLQKTASQCILTNKIVTLFTT